jgi:adenosine deaminase
MEEEQLKANGEERISREWCRLLPKAELHAHLNGSFRKETVCEYAKKQHLAAPIFPLVNVSAFVGFVLILCFRTFQERSFIKKHLMLSV